MGKKYLITIFSRWQQYFIFRTVLSISREQFSLIGNFPSDLPNYTTLHYTTYSDLPTPPLPRERCQAAGNFAARKNFWYFPKNVLLSCVYWTKRLGLGKGAKFWSEFWMPDTRATARHQTQAGLQLPGTFLVFTWYVRFIVTEMVIRGNISAKRKRKLVNCFHFDRSSAP